MTLASNVLTQAEQALGQSLPRIAGALLLLIVGVLIARLAGRLTRKALQAVGADELGQRLGINDVLARVGLPRSLAQLLGTAVRIGLTIVFVIAAVSLLGLAALSDSLNEAILFLPRLFAAAVLIIAGILVADYTRDRLDNTADRLDLAAPIGRIAQVVVFAVFLVTALSQLHVPTGLITVLVGVLVAAAALTIALAFGLGGRDIAREISAGHEAQHAYQLGQTITVEGINGEIVAFTRTATTLKTTHGTTRIPNRLLITSIIDVNETPDRPTGGDD